MESMDRRFCRPARPPHLFSTGVALDTSSEPERFPRTSRSVRRPNTQSAVSRALDCRKPRGRNLQPANDAAQESSLLLRSDSLSFRDHVKPVHRRWNRDDLGMPTRPADLDLVDLRRFAETEVGQLVGNGTEA